jgi:hypothetical protein
MQNIEATHALVARDDVAADVSLWVPHMETGSRGIRKHVQTVELGTTFIESGITWVPDNVGLSFVPP